MDFANACFEVGAAIIAWRCVFLLYRDRVLRGASLAGPPFYLVWNGFSCFFMYALGFWWSLSITVVVLLANLSWCLTALWIWSSKWSRL